MSFPGGVPRVRYLPSDAGNEHGPLVTWEGVWQSTWRHDSLEEGLHYFRRLFRWGRLLPILKRRLQTLASSSNVQRLEPSE